MLPTLAGRLLALVGIVCGYLALWLAGWSPGAHGLAPQILGGAAVAALLATRAVPKQWIDEARLKAAVGDRPVSRLSTWRGVGAAIAVAALAPAFVAPLIDSDDIRHGALIGALTVLLAALAILAWVEARYRVLVRAAGGLGAVGKS